MLLFAVYAYLGLYMALALANVIYGLAAKALLRIPLLLYEAFSGCFVVFMAAAFWTPALKAWTGVASAVLLLLVVLIDMRLSIWGKAEDFGVSSEDFGDSEMDFVKGVSLAFAAPAYIMGLLLALEALFWR